MLNDDVCAIGREYTWVERIKLKRSKMTNFYARKRIGLMAYLNVIRSLDQTAVLSELHLLQLNKFKAMP